MRFPQRTFRGAKIQKKIAFCKFFGHYFPFFLQMLKSGRGVFFRRDYVRDLWEIREGFWKSLMPQIPCVYAGFERFCERWRDFSIKLFKNAFLIPQNSPQKEPIIFPIREKFIPTLGTLFSHLGNVSFPVREQKNYYHHLIDANKMILTTISNIYICIFSLINDTFLLYSFYGS